MEKEWFYIPPGGSDQKGPIPAQVLVKFLEKGMIGPDTLIWKNGLPGWVRMAESEAFKSVALFQALSWYYMDYESNRQGPIITRLLVHKLREGSIDGLTLVYSTVTGGEWKTVGEVAELKVELMKIAAEEEAAENMARIAAAEAQKQPQVFVDEEDIVAQRLNAYKEFKVEQEDKLNHAPGSSDDAAVAETSTKGAGGAASSSSSARSADKRLIADNGKKYCWDDEEQDWVEDDSEGMPVSSGQLLATAANEATHKKRKDSQRDDDNGSCGREDDANDNNSGNESQGSTHNNNREDNRPKKKRAAKKKKGPNNWVYVTGLPSDITMEEIQAHFSKAGLIGISAQDQQAKIKIYRDYDVEGAPCKGDASLCYNAPESVKMAIDIFNDGYIRPKFQIQVSQANFNSSNPTTSSAGSNSVGEVPSLLYSSKGKAGAPLSQAQVKVAKSAMKQALSWNEDDDTGVSKSSALKIIVIEGMFRPSDFEEDPNFEQELERDVAVECEKCGPIEKITVFSQNPRGVVVVKFGTAYAAQECVKLMNGRFFGGVKLRSYYWDGVTNYLVVSSAASSAVAEEEQEKIEEKRLDEFGDWLEEEQEDLPPEFQLNVE